MTPDLDAVVSWVTALIGLLAGAAAGREVVRAAAGPDNPIPYEKRHELEDRYRRWAVETAIAVCPLDDIRCIEREAKRLSEARLLRR